MGVGICYINCCTLLYVHSRFASILTRKRELVTLFNLSSWCLVKVVWLFLGVQWVCLRFVIVVHVFPDQTHLLFLYLICNRISVFFLECNTEKWNSQCEHGQPMEPT